MTPDRKQFQLKWAEILGGVVYLMGVISCILGFVDSWRNRSAPLWAAYEVRAVVVPKALLPGAVRAIGNAPRLEGILANVGYESPRTDLTTIRIESLRDETIDNISIKVPTVVRHLATTVEIEGREGRILEDGFSVKYDSSTMSLAIFNLPVLEAGNWLNVHIWADYGQFSGPRISSSQGTARITKAATYYGTARLIAEFWIWGLSLVFLIGTWVLWSSIIRPRLHLAGKWFSLSAE